MKRDGQLFYDMGCGRYDREYTGPAETGDIVTFDPRNGDGRGRLYGEVVEVDNENDELTIALQGDVLVYRSSDECELVEPKKPLTWENREP